MTQSTIFFFESLKFSTHFMSLEIEDWEKNEQFLVMTKRLKGFKVVNDAAERGVALMTEFNKILTNDEDQKQYMLTIIAAHRQKYSKSVKKSELFA